jgi:hypothetical protein
MVTTKSLVCDATAGVSMTIKELVTSFIYPAECTIRMHGTNVKITELGL